MKFIIAALAGAMVVAAPVAAQTAPGSVVAPVAPAATAAALLVGGIEAAVLRTGTKVPLKTSQELTTKGKKLKVGHRFNLEVAEAVLVNGQTVIPMGAPAVGEITDVRNKGMWGKSGRLVAQVLHVTVGGRQIKLTGSFDDKGTAGGVGAVATSALVFLPAGFFMTGTSAKVAMGTPVVGFVGEDVPVAFAPAAPQPLTVPVSAPAAPQPAS
jgi:hypothetical protein